MSDAYKPLSTDSLEGPWAFEVDTITVLVVRDLELKVSFTVCHFGVNMKI